MKNTFLLLAFGIFILFSCEDPVTIVEGCTDPEAENYNADATDSDNSCAYAREEFVGDYAGVIICGGLIPEPTAFTMSVSEGLTGNNDVIIEIKDTPSPFPIINGFAKTDSLIIPQSTYQLEVLGDLRDVDIDGNCFYQDNMTTLEGVLQIQTEVSGTVITDNCLFTANK